MKFPWSKPKPQQTGPVKFTGLSQKPDISNVIKTPLKKEEKVAAGERSETRSKIMQPYIEVVREDIKSLLGASPVKKARDKRAEYEDFMEQHFGK
jgi:hypothetical protein